MREVTVVLPVCNGAKYLSSSIESVLAQEVDLELLVLDGGSDDATPDIVQSARDSRIRYIRYSRDVGLFARLNQGFAQAQSDLVRIWSHDDLMLPQSLKEFVSFAGDNEDAALIYSDFFFIDSNGRRSGKDDAYKGQRERTPERADSSLSALLFFCFGCLPGNISTVLLRRTGWERAGRFLEKTQQAPDYDMWLRVSQFSQVGFLRQKLVEVRDHPYQLSKFGQKQMSTIEEEMPIFFECVSRLTGIVSSSEAQKFWRQQRGRQHAHWVIRALLRGNMAAAHHGIMALRPYGNVLAQFLVWGSTLNGRLFVESPESFFDRMRPVLEKSLRDG